MRDDLIERAVLATSDVLLPVLQASMSLKPISSLEMVEIAMKVNDELGFELFDDLYGLRLKHDFALITRVVAKNAVRNSR